MFRKNENRRPKDALRLEGYSGYEITLRRDNGRFYVRKRSPRRPLDADLAKHAAKHRYFFERSASPLFKVPPVLREGKAAGRRFYEYEFVEGITLLHFIERSSTEDLTEVLDKLLAVVKEFRETPDSFENAGGEDLHGAIERKIASLAPRAGIPGSAIGRLRKAFRPLRGRREATLCHGDLTFDNIIVGPQGGVWLIDFHNHFYPHAWFDMAKLFQGIEGKWHEFRHGIALPENKLMYVRERLLNGIADFDPEYGSYHFPLLALAFLRIIPYAKNAADRKFIQSQAIFFIDRLP